MSEVHETPDKKPEETTEQAPEGTTWGNPGEFPEFRGNSEKKLTDEEKEERDRVVTELFNEIRKYKNAKLPNGRFRPYDDEFGEICFMLHGVEDSEDPELITKTFGEVRARLTVLEQKIQAEFEAEAQELRDKVAELRTKKAPEGKFQFPDEVFDDLLKEIDSIVDRGVDWAEDILSGVRRKLGKLEQLMGELDKEVGEKLWALYEDPDISIGAHGTAGGRETGFGGVDGPIMKHGIGCFYGDIRRTVSFQDRGRIHAHGELSFLDLLTYSFGYRGKTTRELKIEEGDDFKLGEEVPASQYTAIVAIPKGCYTTDIDLLLTEKRIPVIIQSHDASHPRKMARAIKPKFIVGMVRDGDVNGIVWNPQFNADEMRELSHEYGAKHEEERRKREEERARQLEEDKAEWVAKRERDSKKLSSRLKRLIGRFKKS